ncbi:MAG: diguanylate cyclase [Polyangiaceae bacterium]
MKVLIADDDPITRAVLSRRLGASGYQIIMVESGDAAMAILESDPEIRIALLDWEMPGASGVDVCRFIRAQDRDHYCYVVLITSRDENEDVLNGLNAGADDYVMKPINAVVLELRLRAAWRMLSMQDELLRARDALRIEAMHDALTGLLNRGALRRALEQEVARGNRSGQAVSVVLADVDLFKQVNDTHGHAAGDVVLKSVADCLKAGVRGYDTVARYGGEEFVVLLPECEWRGASRVAERARESIEALQVVLPHTTISVTSSFGVASTTQVRVSDAAELVAAADRALYRAKRRGRNRVELATPEDFQRIAPLSGAPIHG